MSFFSHTDYRLALKELVADRKTLEPRFGFHVLAEAARIQRPYMSKVIAGTAELSLDQMHLIAEALHLDEERSEFLELLLNYSRSSVFSRKKKLKKRIDEIAESKLKISANIKSKVIIPKTDQEMSLYYLNPWTQIVHVALSVSKFSEDPKLLADTLGIPYVEMQIILQNLISMNLVSKNNSRDAKKNQRIAYVPLENHIHLDRSSPLFGAWQTQLELLGMQRKRSAPQSKSYSFMAVYSATEDLRKKTITKFTDFLTELQEDVKNADPLTTYQIGFDLFPWT